MMVEAVLFDLDDTLLGNDVDTFVPHYFKLLGAYAVALLPAEELIQALLTCTRITIQNVDRSRTNYEVFWEAFTARTGLNTAVAEPFFARFYEEVFPQLQAVTVVRPSARPLVQTCLDAGLKVVVATNPLFPRAAIEQRLAWAGTPVTDFDFALVTTMENMHTTKPHSLYYAEILQRIGCAPDKALMVGDSWTNDITPAAALGMHTFWTPPSADPVPDANLLTGQGTLDDLYARVQNGWLSALE